MGTQGLPEGVGVACSTAATVNEVIIVGLRTLAIHDCIRHFEACRRGRQGLNCG